MASLSTGEFALCLGGDAGDNQHDRVNLVAQDFVSARRALGRAIVFKVAAPWSDSVGR
jgi:hypothetical protein